MLSNRLNLPNPIFEAISRDPYDSGDSNISATKLIAPPRVVQLNKRHQNEIVEDIADRLWATYGQLIHLMLERATADNPKMSERYLFEERLFVEVEGWKVSGQFDLYDKETKTLYDYKFCGAYAVKSALAEGKIEWTQQLNILRWLLFKSKGIVAEKLAIIGMVRDYSERIGNEGIPPIATIPIEVWNMPSAEAYVKERVAMHQLAEKMNDEHLPRCTDEERWLNKKTGIFNRCRKYCPALPFCDIGKSGK